MTPRQKRIEAALSRLAAMYEYGELQATTTPAVFLERVADELDELRAQANAMRDVAAYAREQQRQWELDGGKDTSWAMHCVAEKIDHALSAQPARRDDGKPQAREESET